jgi:hypothetical protein
MHDAILIGIGTALNDDPQLNSSFDLLKPALSNSTLRIPARHLPPRAPDQYVHEHQHPYHLPRPVILDSNLRLHLDCKLLKNYSKGQGRRPWILCSTPSTSPMQDSSSVSRMQEWTRRKEALEAAGASIIEVSTESGGTAPLVPWVNLIFVYRTTIYPRRPSEATRAKHTICYGRGRSYSHRFLPGNNESDGDKEYDRHDHCDNRANVCWN